MNKIHVSLFFSLLGFTALLFVISTDLIDFAYGEVVLTISSFLFGILAGFYIYVTTTDYTILKEVAAAETSAYISLFEQVRLYAPESLLELKEKIDSLVRKSFDHSFIEYPKETWQDYMNIKEMIQGLPFIPERSSIHQTLLGVLNELTIARQRLTVLATKSLSVFQWIVLCVLAFVVILTLVGLRNGSLFFDIVTVLISTAIVLVLLLIRDIDDYIWNESTFGFYIFENVLQTIGELPYYPAEDIAEGRIKPIESIYRVGTFSDPKDQRNREIIIVKNA